MHGTCVAFGGRAALLRGAPGTGKSDLALRFIARYPATRGNAGASLVADDQVVLERRGSELVARAPEEIAGMLEVRGVGLVRLDYANSARLRLIVDLVAGGQAPRLPPDPLPREEVLGVEVPVTVAEPHENSAPEKLKLMLAGSF